MYAVRGISTGPTQPSATVRRKGRPKGSGSFAKQDEPLISEMDKLIRNGDANSPHYAAKLVADKATGAGAFDSKVRRLERLYKKTFEHK
jgi:hypothetical protein